MKDQRINSGNIEINISEYRHAGDAVIFLHYGGGNLMMWQQVIPHFQADYHLVLIDQRGHGKSDKPKKGYHIDQMAEDVIAVMNELQLERAHIVGSSMGAEVSLSIAANYPEKVLSLVCEGALYSENGPYGIWEGSEAEFKEHAAQEIEKRRNVPQKVFPSIDAMADDYREMFEEAGWWNETFDAVIRHDATRIGEDKYIDSWGIVAPDYMEKYLFYRFEEYYKKVKCPILMIPDTYHGQSEREKMVMRGLLKLVDRGKITEIPGWVHPYGWMITPAAVSKTVLEFLAEVSDYPVKTTGIAGGLT